MNYETPAGGCLLTDPGFCIRLQDLMENQPEWGADDARLLRVGRQWRLGPRTKAIASRCEEENRLLEEWAAPDDALFLATDRPGAVVLLRGEKTAEAERTAAGLAVHHSKSRAAGQAAVRRWDKKRGEGERLADCAAVSPDGLAAIRGPA